MSTPHVVLVDDEEDLREPLAAYLSDDLDVSEAGSGTELDAVIAARSVDLVVLDVSMPEEDGFSIARRLRASGAPIGIIMLTARRDVADRVAGLELGADDYVMKPVEPRELLARIRSVLRRIADQAQPSATLPAPAPPAAPPGQYATEFWIPTGRGQIRVPIEAIEWIEAAKDYALLHTAERSHMLRVTMAALERDLDPAAMVRVHRSSFVCPAAIVSISQVGRNITLVLNSGASVRVGPQHAAEVRAKLGR
ncbi:LytR/AlgR family response regulator transcription factor [Sphingomonas sp.]|uniref:LytR/AlgR family response regulator transcription factor n=1 Tax=Sphingomonas sp. TaxID=28214 RepID=UPI003CC64B03